MAKTPKTRHSRKRLWIEAAIAVVLLALIISAAWYLRSPYFAELMRRKAVEAMEEITGGRVDIQTFHWNVMKLEVDADNVTIHGKESASEPPYIHADQVHLRLRIVSFFQTKITLEYLALDHPAVNLIVYPDGSTNAPEPRVKPQVSKSPIERLFEIAVRRLEVRQGTLLWSERKVPLDFVADDVGATMSYDRLGKRFDGHLQIGKTDTKYADYRDVAAQLETEFSLWQNRAEIKSLKITSQKSSLEASGKVVNFSSPQIQLTYNSVVDIAQLGAVMREYTLRNGTASLNGSASYSPAERFSTRGRTSVRGLDYVDVGLALKNTSGGADYVLQGDRLTLTHLVTRMLGGEISGDADFRNLTSSPPPTPVIQQATAKPGSKSKTPAPKTRSAPATPSGPPPMEGSARLRLSGLSLAELTRTLATRAMPIDKFNAAGSVSGTVDVKWRRSLRDALAELQLAIVPPAQTPPGQLPITANLHGTLNVRAQQVEFSALTLVTPHTHLTASGTLGSANAALNLNLETNSLSEFQGFLTAADTAPVPIELGGEAKFNGTIIGRLTSPQISGHAQADDFTFLYTPPEESQPQPQPVVARKRSFFHRDQGPPPPPKPAPPPRRVHIDQFVGDVQLSPSLAAVHHGVIQEGTAHISLDGSVVLERGSFTRTSPFQMQLAMHNADVEDFQRTVGLSYPVSGTVSLNLQASGTQANPRGSGQFTLVSGEAWGRPIKLLSSKLTFAGHAAHFEEIELHAARGEVLGSAGYDFDDKNFTFDLSGESINLEDIPQIQTARLPITGVAKFAVKGSGTLDEPVLNGHIQIAELNLGGEAIGSLNAEAETHGRHMKLTARSNFPRANLALDGDVLLQGDMPANLTLQFARLDVDPFLRTEVRGHITNHSSLAGSATVSGPLRRPAELSGSMKVQEFSVEVEKIPISTEGPIELRLANGVVTVDQMAIHSQDTRFTISGSASFLGDRPLDLRAQGHINLGLIHTINPDIASYGSTDIDMVAAGTMKQPLLSGQVNVTHAGLSMIDVPSGLGDINGTLVFKGNRVDVQQLTAHTGGGLVKIGGFVTYGESTTFDLTGDGTDIRFRYGGISVTSDQSVHLSGSLQNATLKGDVTVTRFAQIPSADLNFALAPGTPSRIPNPNDPLNHLHLDVRILSTPELTVQTSLAKLSGDVDLRLRGTAARPVLLGRINIAEGDIKLNGSKYHLERGDITFIDPVRIDPVLDIEATTRVRDYDITIGLHGTLERLNTTYRSDPPLSSDDIVALLAFGRTQEEGGSGAGTLPVSGFTENASNAVLGRAINQSLTGRVSRLFGVSSIRINPSVGGPDNNPNARLTVEQQVSNNVTLTYITNLTQSAQQVIQFEYNISREYTIQAIRDENGVVSFDLLVRKRRK